MSTTMLLGVLLVAAVVLLGLAWGKDLGRKVYAFDDKVEQRRKRINELTILLTKWGCNDITKPLGCYVVGDYDGMFLEVEKLCSLYTDPKKAALELRELFDNMLQFLAKNEETRNALYEQIEKVKKQFPPIPPPVPPTAPS